MKINILLLATIAILAFTPNYFGQLQTIDYQWGVVPGKLTRTTNIVDGQRVTNGPFSFTGNTVAMGATTLIVKGNFKNGNYNGAFNMNWSAIGAEAFTLSAVGVFSSGLLDGLWNFKIKSWEKVSYQLVKSNREVSLTFKKGQLIKGSFKDLRVNNYVIFTCDEFGDMLSFVSGSKGSGYLEEEKTDYVHGIATIESTKDVASGKYLKKPSSVTDTAILNNKNFNQQSSTFNYGNNIYKRSEAYYAFVTMFTDDLWLGQFKSDGGDAVAGYIPFIDGRYVILPVIYGSYKKLQNLTDNLDFIAAEESYLKNDLNKALVLYEKIKSDDLIPNEVSKITSKIADLKKKIEEEKKKIEEEKKKIEDDAVKLNFELYPYADGSIYCAAGATAIVNVTNPKTGRIWMDRNLGASQVATSSDDSKAYGDFYQWGRRADGHQCRTSPTTAILSSVNQPAHGNFILAKYSPLDWRSPQKDNLWQGVNGVNNPCPSTYRLPTDAELDAEVVSWSQEDGSGAYNSPLKFTMAGQRNGENGSIVYSGDHGEYWSSTGYYGYCDILLVTHFYARVARGSSQESYRSNGLSVRCIKD